MNQKTNMNILNPVDGLISHDDQIAQHLRNQRLWSPRKTTAPNYFDGEFQITRTVQLPANHGLFGMDPMPRRGTSCLKWVGEGSGQWMIRNIQSDGNNWNGNFSTRLEQFRLECQGKAKGAAIGGAQQSQLKWIEIFNPKDVGIQIMQTSRSFTIDQCNVDGPENHLSQGLIGLRLLNCKSITLGANSFQWCREGIVSGAQAVTCSGFQSMEQVGTAITFLKSARESVFRLEVSQHDTSYPLVDFSQCKLNDNRPELGLVIHGTVEKTSGRVWYKNENGDAVDVDFIYGSPGNQDGAGFEIVL